MSNDTLPVLAPAFGPDEDVVVFFAANAKFVPVMSCVLQSLCENASALRRYDIVILSSDIEEADQDVLRAQVSVGNIALQFFDLAPNMARFAGLRSYGHFRVETYFRLLIPEIAPWCAKALYLDADIIVNHDVAELFDTPMGDCLVAAAHDPDTAGQYYGFDPTRKDFMDKHLPQVPPEAYFQAGVLVMNLAQFRESYTSEEMLELAASQRWPLLDQDVLNCLCAGRVRYVDMAWNTLMDWQRLRRIYIISQAPAVLRAAYDLARTQPYIVHYAGPENKPWEFGDVDMGEYFWKYAQYCPYFDRLVEMQEESRKASIRRARRVSDFWKYRLIVPLADIFAPPGTSLRHLGYWVYRQLNTQGY